MIVLLEIRGSIGPSPCNCPLASLAFVDLAREQLVDADAKLAASPNAHPRIGSSSEKNRRRRESIAADHCLARILVASADIVYVQQIRWISNT
jgi:uncharacterized protein (DUF3084 family)